MLLFGKWGFLLPMLISSSVLLAQEISPYSRFALGVPVSSSFTAQKGMGRLVGGYRDPLHINFANPASFSNLGLTTLEAGFKFATRKITDGQTDQSYRAGNTFFDYLAIGFPVGSKAGAGFGIVPYSETNYSFESQRTYDTLNAVRLFEGTGRTYQLFIGAAYRHPKSDTSANTVSFGINFSYFFGDLDRSNILLIEKQGFYNTRITSTASLSNLALTPGFQYRRKLNDTLNVVLGAYGIFPVASLSSEYTKWDRFIILSGGSATVDTLAEQTRDNNDFRIPVQAGIGATIGNMNKWLAGVDIKYSVWDGLDAFADDVTLVNALEINAGGEFRPDFRSQKLFRTANYRIGAFYNQGHLEVDRQRISEYGLTLGLDLPIKTQFSRLNFSFEIGKRGTTSGGLVSETFFRAYIGLTLNDKWFIKPKYD